jgi:hypothetical protein
MNFHDIVGGTWRRCRESPSKHVGKPASFDTKDSDGSGGGFVEGYATIGGRCAPCLGVMLLVSRKRHSFLSRDSSDTIGIDVRIIIRLTIYVY